MKNTTSGLPEQAMINEEITLANGAPALMIAAELVAVFNVQGVPALAVQDKSHKWFCFALPTVNNLDAFFAALAVAGCRNIGSDVQPAVSGDASAAPGQSSQDAPAAVATCPHCEGTEGLTFTAQETWDFDGREGFATHWDGVPNRETPVTCLACSGDFILDRAQHLVLADALARDYAPHAVYEAASDEQKGRK